MLLDRETFHVGLVDFHGDQRLPELLDLLGHHLRLHLNQHFHVSYLSGENQEVGTWGGGGTGVQNVLRSARVKTDAADMAFAVLLAFTSGVHRHRVCRSAEHHVGFYPRAVRYILYSIYLPSCPPPVRTDHIDNAGHELRSGDVEVGVEEHLEGALVLAEDSKVTDLMKISRFRKEREARLLFLGIDDVSAKVLVSANVLGTHREVGMRRPHRCKRNSLV